ncbi:MAG: HAD-IA family hydrolase [archaeon]|jgi:putative hydrolase of the HAD superfamily
MTNAIKGIIFDMHGVLYFDKISEVEKAFSNSLNIPYGEFREFRRPYGKDLLAGKISTEFFLVALKKKFGIKKTIDEMVQLWEKSHTKIITNFNSELLDYIKNIRKTRKVGLISNIYEIQARVQRRTALFDSFSPCILSCEVGLAKPQKEIFELVLTEWNLKSQECIFVDDEEQNIVAAKNMGFSVVNFKGNEKLFPELKELIG